MMALLPICGVAALISAIVGVIVGAVAMSSDPKRGKLVLMLNVIALITVVIIVVMELVAHDVI